MLYHLLYPLADEVGLFNVFRYITFRSMYALVTAWVLTIVFGPMFIRWLTRIKFGQPIQEDGVAAHQVKAGTPTMGGLLIGFATLSGVFLFGDLTNAYVWLCVFVFVGFGLVGLRRRLHQGGAQAEQGPFGQGQVRAPGGGGRGGPLLLLLHQPAYDSRLALPFIKFIRPDLGWFYIVFAVLVMVGASNGGQPDRRPGRPGHRPEHRGRGLLRPVRVRGRSFTVRRLSQGGLHARRGRGGRVLRRPGGRGHGLFVVQRPSGPDLHGRRGLAVHRRGRWASWPCSPSTNWCCSWWAGCSSSRRSRSSSRSATSSSAAASASSAWPRCTTISN